MLADSDLHVYEALYFGDGKFGTITEKNASYISSHSQLKSVG
jgi:hypothetical protein